MAESKTAPAAKPVPAPAPIVEQGKLCTHEGEEKYIVRAKGDSIGYYGKLKYARRRYGPQRQHPEAGDPFVIFKCQFSKKWMERVKLDLDAEGRQRVGPNGKPHFVPLVVVPLSVAPAKIEDEHEEIAAEKAEVEAVGRAANKPAK